MFIYLLIALAVFILDQISKWMVKTNLEIGEKIPVLGHFFVLTSHRNQGAAFGILQGRQTFFLIITIVFLIGISWYLYRACKTRQRWIPFALSLMLGGAVGNFLDRALYGEVVDFIQLNFKFSLFGWDVDYIYPIFNVADSGIVVGTAIILADSLLSWRREAKKSANAAKDTTQ